MLLWALGLKGRASLSFEKNKPKTSSEKEKQDLLVGGMTWWTWQLNASDMLVESQQTQQHSTGYWLLPLKSVCQVGEESVKYCSSIVHTQTKRILVLIASARFKIVPGPTSLLLAIRCSRWSAFKRLIIHSIHNWDVIVQYCARTVVLGFEFWPCENKLYCIGSLSAMLDYNIITDVYDVR